MTGADLLCATLRQEGVSCLFGVPGTQTADLYDAFQQAALRTILTSHELAAAFMANGYYRASGKPGVIVTIPGPGFTYALTGIAEARHDSAAVLHIVGAPTKGKFQLQAIDQAAIAAPLTKAVFTVEETADIPRMVREALATTLSGEPGPVLLQVALRALTREASDAGSRPPSIPDASDAVAGLDELIALYCKASRPVLLVGQGAAASAAHIRALAEARGVPVVTTLSGRGVLPEDHRLAMGFDVLRGRVNDVNALFGSADLIVALGCKLAHNGSAGFGLTLPQDRFVHVDASADVPGANYPTRLQIVARVESVLPALVERSVHAPASQWTDTQLADMRARIRSPIDTPEPVIRGDAVETPARFFAWLRDALPRDAMLVTDSGIHQVLARRHYSVLAPRGLICPSDFQSMGFGLPAGLGAAIAAPGTPVVVLMGDGGFQMSGMEMLTALREQVPLVVIVFNDGHLNQIRLQQLKNLGRTTATRLQNPDFEALASAFGVNYLRFGGLDASAIRAAFTADGPTLVEVMVGDSGALRLVAAKRRAKSAVRGMLGARMLKWIRQRLGGAR